MTAKNFDKLAKLQNTLIRVLECLMQFQKQVVIECLKTLQPESGSQIRTYLDYITETSGLVFQALDYVNLALSTTYPEDKDDEASMHKSSSSEDKITAKV